jgi:hypothetical protein
MRLMRRVQSDAQGRIGALRGLFLAVLVAIPIFVHGVSSVAQLPRNISVILQMKGHVIKVPSQKQLERQFRPYAVQLGKLVFAWNRLHEKLSVLFWKVTGIQNDIAIAVWYSTDSDRAQRQMLRKAAEVAFAKDDKKREGVVWLLNQIDHALAGSRNDAIHAPLAFFTDVFGTELKPSLSGSPRAKGLAGKDLMTEFKWYRECADVLANYTTNLYAALSAPQLRPWPDIPSLPQKGRTKSRKARFRRKLAKQLPRPPRSFRA